MATVKPALAHYDLSTVSGLTDNGNGTYEVDAVNPKLVGSLYVVVDQRKEEKKITNKDK